MPPIFKYFKPEEIGGLDETFVEKLDRARHIAQIPFVITSGLRTPEENQSLVAKGAAPDSAHLYGTAVDLRVENNHEVFLILSSAFAVGINRFGIYVDAANQPTHVHLDVDKEKVPEVIWIKREGVA